VIQMPTTVAFTTAQMTVGLLIGIVGLVGSGVAFGRLTERQKGDHKILNDTLATLEKGMASITTSMNEMREQWQRAREERVDWNYWRVVTDSRLGDHDEEILTLKSGHGELHTRVAVFEDRRKGEGDRRHHD
jgi:hypothetical protein